MHNTHVLCISGGTYRCSITGKVSCKSTQTDAGVCQQSIPYIIVSIPKYRSDCEQSGSECPSPLKLI